MIMTPPFYVPNELIDLKTAIGVGKSYSPHYRGEEFRTQTKNALEDFLYVINILRELAEANSGSFSFREIPKCSKEIPDSSVNQLLKDGYAVYAQIDNARAYAELRFLRNKGPTKRDVYATLDLRISGEAEAMYARLRDIGKGIRFADFLSLPGFNYAFNDIHFSRSGEPLLRKVA